MYNREFKEINTHDKSYILGLFYSDGNVSDEKRNQSRIQLSIKDKHILKQIKVKFPFFKFYYDKRERCTLYSGFKAFKEDLINFGVLPDKSFSNKNKLKFPKFKNVNLYRSFIRGYFDGDGGCSLTKKYTRGKWDKRVYIYSCNYQFLKKINKYLNNNSIITSLGLSGNLGNRPLAKQDFYKITIKTISHKKYFDLIYNNDSLHLKRKKKLYSKILKTKYFNKKACPDNCPNCKHNYIVADGYYYYKSKKQQRFLCRKCNKTFCP